jgi:acyl phosphate:glycerol-3-phosphate acyltransferase
VFTLAVVALISYLMGSFPAGYLAGRIVGVDIRKVGSGNIGATNVLRILGKRFGYPVFLIDFTKGFVAVMLAVSLASRARASANFVELCAITAGVFSVVGHSYPVWLRFKGGKGVATTIGVLFGLMPLVALIVCAVWVITFEIGRYVSLASVVAALALPATVAVMWSVKQPNRPMLFYFSVCLAVVIIMRHRSNLSRLFHGTEPRFRRK